MGVTITTSFKGQRAITNLIPMTFVVKSQTLKSSRMVARTHNKLL